MEKNSKFKRVLGAKDILAIAFGAMIGWSWVINSGDWLVNAGFMGTFAAFLIGGLTIFLVGLIYAELMAAMPQCGGEHVFSYRAYGAAGSFVCTWGIILGYVATAAFEAAAFPTVIKYLVGDRLNIGLMYHVAGEPIYASYVIIASILTVFITWANIRGVKTAAVVQRVLMLVILLSGLLLIGAAAVRGDAENLVANLFGDKASNGNQSVLGGIFTVACMTPFLFIGFDVIPQTAEEIKLERRKTSGVILLSIGMALVFYFGVIFSVSYIMTPSEVHDSMRSGLVSADAMAKAFGSKAMGNVLIVGGMCGIITSWNAFLLGGSRALYSMGEAYMLPRSFAVLHREYKTPVYAILLCGAACFAAPFFGKPVLIWLVDAASFGCCVAYFMVSIAFLVLRRREPQMERPYKVHCGGVIGTAATLLSGFLMMLYVIPVPFSSCTLVWQEWIVVGLWIAIGGVFALWSKLAYKDDFGKISDGGGVDS